MPTLCFSAGNFAQIESLETLLPAPHLEICKRHCNNKRARGNNDFLPVVASQRTAQTISKGLCPFNDLECLGDLGDIGIFILLLFLESDKYSTGLKVLSKMTHYFIQEDDNNSNTKIVHGSKRICDRRSLPLKASLPVRSVALFC